MLNKIVTVIIDRPIGSYHPTHKNICYPVNYGYIPNVIAGDGEWQDVYILGVNQPLKQFTGRVIAVIKRLNDIENKLVVAPENVNFTKEQIQKAVNFQEKYFKIEIITK